MRKFDIDKKSAIELLLFAMAIYSLVEFNFFPDPSVRWQNRSPMVTSLTYSPCLTFRDMPCHSRSVFIYNVTTIPIVISWGTIMYRNYRKRKGKEYQWHQFDDEK